MEKAFAHLFSQVHQPFFIVGIFHAIVVMIIFMLGYKGIIALDISSIDFHAYSLIYLVFTNFFIGFVFTTFPRFCGHAPIENRYYSIVFWMFQLGSLLFLVGAFVSLYVVGFGLAVHLLALFLVIFQLQKIFLKTNKNMQDDPKWILIAFYLGLIGILAYINYFFTATFNPFGFVFYFYFIFLTFVIAQRMVPFFSHSRAPKNIYLAPIFFMALLVKVTCHNFFGSLEPFIDIIIGAWIFVEIRKWDVSLKGMADILKILHLGLYWLVFGFIGGGVISLITEAPLMQLQIHIFSLGFVTVMLIGFGTRVTLGHSGRTPHADNFTKRIFYALHILVVVRILFSLLFGHNFFWLFDLSVFLWVVVLIIWGARYIPMLAKPMK
ncbi:MAG: NnrS family protein [Sulfurimonadaceae bacterium]|jgi:uncharacterized protein involved in response to NO|nr:NnrS family protein [Sulfurimonadaceae bacterium]